MAKREEGARASASQRRSVKAIEIACVNSSVSRQQTITKSPFLFCTRRRIIEVGIGSDLNGIFLGVFCSLVWALLALRLLFFRIVCDVVACVQAYRIQQGLQKSLSDSRRSK